MMTKPWLEFKDVITKLYINEGKTLAEVRKIMKDTFDFEASIRSYRQHFDAWGVMKYNCKKRNSRRQQKAHARGLPSPSPEMSVVSPESLTRSSSISSGSSQSLSPRVIQPRPYYGGQEFEHTGAGFRGSYARSVNGEGPHWGGMNMPQTMLRGPGSSPHLPVQTSSSCQQRGSMSKYVPIEYPEPSWDRSSYQVSHHPDSKYYGPTYEDSVPRSMHEPFSPPFDRPGEYQQPLRAPRPGPRSMPRLPMMQSGAGQVAVD